MNNILQLKGRFEHRKNESTMGIAILPKNKRVLSSHLRSLKEQLENILKYWEYDTSIEGALVSVHYTSVMAKSNRIKILLSESGMSTNDSIRGAKFEWEEEEGKTIQKHVFTHYVPLSAIQKAIHMLQITADIIEQDFSGSISDRDMETISKKQGYYHDKELARTNFLKIVMDGYHVSRFDIDKIGEYIEDNSIITIYKTNVETKKLLSRYGIAILDNHIIGETTLYLNRDQVELLYNNAPYLVSMSLTDFTRITDDDLDIVEELRDDNSLIPHPGNEPVIGVIDTLFNENVYFAEWVEYQNLLDPNIPIEPEDKKHGTAVSSIIVDGPKGNPLLDDGCGRFRVRHFGVAKQSGFSSFAMLKMIRKIISTNRDIKVWNLSLGSKKEIKENFISPEAAELDRIQSEYDVIFVISGTNIPKEDKRKTIKIGAPADSLNSLVVNAVDFNKKPASYTRVGPVLSFFNKPDISYYGGDGTTISEKMVVCVDDLGAYYMCGTSVAAPWITRKLAYLINVLGLSREVAKALIIDSAAGWNRQDDVSHKTGYGIVPIRIEDIIYSADDEIRFIIHGIADEYETYTYNLPVPIVNNMHPYYARATLAYFPQCDRNQGVDYTSTEMDLHFGRIIEEKDKAKIKSINNNHQAEAGLNVIYEKDARKLYRKWDNVKHISETIKQRAVPRKVYGPKLWGLSIISKERIGKKNKLPFGIVITLKEMYGENRIDDFIKMCIARGWLVSRLDIKAQLDVYAKAEEEIVFE